jgi:hypothetical protein
MSAVISPAVSLHIVAEPGDLTSYELIVVQRHGGGWLVMCEQRGICPAKIKTHSGHLYLEPTDGSSEEDYDSDANGGRGWTSHELEIVAKILTDTLVFNEDGSISVRA